MLIAAAEAGRLALSGKPDAGDSWSLIEVRRAGSEASVLLNGTRAVGITGSLRSLQDLDLRAITQAPVIVEWGLGFGGALAVATIQGGGGNDRIVLRLEDAAATAGTIEVFGNAGNDSITGTALAEQIYGGAGNDTLEGGGGDDTLFGDAGDDLLIGGDGIDTAEFTGGTNRVIDLAITDAQATGSGMDRLIGIENLKTGYGKDLLLGDDGANRLDGGQGDDTLVGRGGDDTYIVAQPGDVVIELAGEGDDTIFASCDRVLEAEVEHLVLTGNKALSGTGNDKANRLIGNSAANTLSGGAGDDTLIGNGGADWLIGGSGDDTYEADALDVLIEEEDGGHDRVRSAVSFMLLPNIEDLELTGSDDVNGTGNELDNLILGNSAANLLDGGGGADTLIGGQGDDTYVHDLLDTIIELEGEGIDTLLSDETVVLPDMLENLVLIGIGLKDGTGNALANHITGNDDDNLLDGGAGADTLVGGLGNDIYVVDGSDTVVELADQGIDTIRSTVSMTLPDHVENLELLAGALNATGNSLDNRLVGNDGANVLTGGAGSDTMIGGGGNNIYIADGTDRIIEVANGGWDIVRASGSFDLPVNVEELVLVGLGADVARGNAAANRITGNAAANVIDGRGGDDTLIGGAGDDIYFSDGRAWIIETATGGRDTVMASGNITLDPWIEEVILTGNLPLMATGNAMANVIRGNAGANVLNGGGGADQMMGGAGDDYYITDGLDTVTEMDREGWDTIWTPVSLTLPPFIEVLQLGGNGNITGIGNAGANLILGNAGANRLEGRGGADTMIGGAGNDIYVSDGLDLIVEAAGGGWDTVYSHVGLTLSANVEAGVLTGMAPVALTGNALANRLVGNAGANRINGGAGRDTMIGGAGNDIYHSDGLDVIVEVANGGTDTIVASVAMALPLHVERLVLGGAVVAGYGNAAANHITGNAAANFLDGRGGPDTLVGGAGNDTYIVRGAERIMEALAPAGGYDRVNAHVSHTLAPGVEALTLLGVAANGVGNDLGNRINGNAASNVLHGRGGNDALFGGAGNDRLWGGSGNDQLSGGAGADRFVFYRNEGRDVILDYQDGIDRIEIGGARWADLGRAQVGAHAHVSFTGTTIVVMNTSVGALGANDFVFT